MLLQIVNDKGVTVMRTENKSCIPDDTQLSCMYKTGYKFKIDGKTVSIKKIKEIRDNV